MEPHEIRAGMAHELGCKFDDMLEAAKLEVARDEGSKAALTIAAKKILELHAVLAKELDDGAFAQVEGPLAVAEVVKKYLDKVVKLLEVGANNAEGHRLQAMGQVQAYQLMVGNMKKVHDLENGQALVRKAAAEGLLPEEHPRVPGLHPGLPLRERRRLEDEAAQKPAPEAVPEPPKPDKRKGSRSKVR